MDTRMRGRTLLPALALAACLAGATGAAAQAPEPGYRAAAATEDTPAPPAVSRLARAGHRLVLDFRGLASVDAATIAGAAGGAAALVARSDRTLTRAAVDSGSLEETLDGGARFGGAVQTIGAVAAFAAGALSGQPRVTQLGAELVQAQIVSGTITQALKFGVQRQRPDGRRFSFPSGHASATFANATVLQREFGWKAGIVGYAAASYVGVSRLSENKHYASDVVIGAAIGIISGRAVTRDGHSRARVTAFGGRRELGVLVAWPPRG